MNIDMLYPHVLPRAMTQAPQDLYLHRISLQKPRRSRSERRGPPFAAASSSEAGEHNHCSRVRARHLNRQRSFDLIFWAGGLNHGERGV
jgi:hypothetical protein